MEKKLYKTARRRETALLYLMMLPGLAYILINNYLPLGGIFIAFKKINYSLGIFKSPWVGFKNFEYLFATPDAWVITRNTVLYNLVFIVLETIFGIFVAIFLADMRRRKLAKFYQAMLLLPNLVSMVICSYLVFAFFSNENGFFNKSLLPALGLDPVSWYSAPGPWPVILTVVFLWADIGCTAIIYLSSIIGIDRTLYESASLDGASKWQQIKHITIPCIRPAIVTLLILNIGSIFFSNFGLFYLVPMNSGMLYNVTSTLDTYVYNALMRNNNIGMASAAGLYQSVVGFILVLAANLVTRRIDKENALF